MRRPGHSKKAYRQQLQQQVSETAAAAERDRLARELHDSIKQQIFSIRMSAMVAQAQLETNIVCAREALQDIQQSADEAQVEMQALLQQLRSSSLEHTSLAEAIKTQAQALEYRSQVEVTVEIMELPQERCPLAMQETVFRIVQESFANIARHARARQVTCSITHDDELLFVTIQDDGQGFDLQQPRGGMGLTNIEERARSLDGSVEVQSRPGKGTAISVRLPLFLPAAIKQEREQQAQEKAAQIRAGLHLRATLALFTMLLLLIDIDLGLFTPGVSESRRELVELLLLCGLAMMFYGIASAHLAVRRLRRYRDEQDTETAALHLQVQQGWTASLRLALFGSWHIVLWVWHLASSMPGWQSAGGFLLGATLLLALMLYAQARLKAARDSYYCLLTGQPLTRAIARSWRGLRIRVIILLCLAIALGLRSNLFFFAPVMLWQWLADSFLFAFLIHCFCLIIDTWQIRAWRNVSMMIGPVV